MSVLTRPQPMDLPAGAAPVDPDGLLARVRRPCPDHAGESVCVGRDHAEGCMVFWCERGEHHFQTRG
ncbi:MAG: hypothetical protein RIB67_07215 [Miltoncostaeaceae bacterium]